MDAAMGGGAAPGGGAMPMASTNTPNIGQFGGKVLKKRTREKIQKQQEQMYKAQQPVSTPGKPGDIQRNLYTSIELALLKELVQLRRNGEIKRAVYPHYKVKKGAQPYSIDFALPDIKVGIEVDGQLFHSTEKQVQEDEERDSRLSQDGWTILRFTDHEIESRMRGVVETILKTVTQKEQWLKDNMPDEGKPNEK
jgi:very-short-patch-repair endonuclease